MAGNTFEPRPPDIATVPNTNGPDRLRPADPLGDLYMASQNAAFPPGEDDEGTPDPLGVKMLQLVRAAESSAQTYANFVRKSWERAYRAFHNKHFDTSKYLSKDYRARSKFFRPKTRTAVRRFEAGISSSLFSTVDAIAIQAGNESDPISRAGAALMQEVLNYRTDRTSGKNAIPWFKTSMGAAQDATLTGIVASKQYWKLQQKKIGEQPKMMPHPETGEMGQAFQVNEDGTETPVMEPVMKTVFDRPDCILVPGEQVLIDSGADWTDPAQSSAFLVLKWPMKIDDIREREKDPQDPWKHLDDSILKGSQGAQTGNALSIRAAREGGTDRYNQVNQSDYFSTVWVNECFVRYQGEDYTFFSIRDQHLLTDPKPVEEAYPWNDGERPIVIGYGSLEAHKIFPMAPAESWQQTQEEINDLANLTSDAVKLNISPITKVKRGRQVDLDALRRRGPGTNLLMTDITDVEFEKPAGVDAGAWQQMERLNNDFDTAAGQFDSGSVQSNRQLNDTVGGMRLISGAANTMQEFDQRVFFETWAEPAIAQIVRLCQYYEHDETILGLCGDRAKLYQKHGINEITDSLLDAQITVRLDIGIGAGDPQQRIAKFTMAVGAALPLIKDSPQFASGEYQIDVEAVMQEVFGAAGYRDGGQRFIKKNPPQQGPNPAQQLEMKKLESEIQRNQAQGDNLRAAAWKNIQSVQMDKVGMVQDLVRDQADSHHRTAERAMQGATTLLNHHAAEAQAEREAKQPKPQPQP